MSGVSHGGAAWSWKHAVWGGFDLDGAAAALHVRSSHYGMCDVPVACYIVGGISAQCMGFIVCSRVRFGRV